MPIFGTSHGKIDKVRTPFPRGDLFGEHSTYVALSFFADFLLELQSLKNMSGDRLQHSAGQTAAEGRHQHRHRLGHIAS